MPVAFSWYAVQQRQSFVQLSRLAHVGHMGVGMADGMGDGGDVGDVVGTDVGADVGTGDGGVVGRGLGADVGTPEGAMDLGRTRVRNSQLQRLLSRPFSARFG